MRLFPTRFSDIQTFGLVGFCLPSPRPTSRLLDWYPGRRLKLKQVLKLHLPRETPHIHLRPHQSTYATKLCNAIKTIPFRIASFHTSGSARCLCSDVYHYCQSLQLDSSLDVWLPLHLIQLYRPKLSSPRCLEITSSGIETARLRRLAPCGHQRLETLAPAITYELLLTWELSPLLYRQEASDLLLK